MNFGRICIILGLLLVPRTVAAGDNSYLVGRGKADITGPVVGVQLWGFSRADQIGEGLHTRLYSRAFIIAEPNGQRVALVTADIGSITNFIQLDVVERLQREYGDLYTIDNVLLSATHTHSAPGGYWHYGATTPLGSPFIAEYYEAIVGGITSALMKAHQDLAPGTITINRGLLEDGGVNRSMPAYLNNPASERARFDAPTDREMTVLRFTRENGDIGSINWFAVHPTAMNYYNRLVSGDHKGAASQLFENGEGPNFVAAFAQSNCGDVTPNTNLDNTGPGATDGETTRIFAERQYAKAVELFASADETLSGPIASRQIYVDMSGLAVTSEFTNAGEQHTCPSAYGYSFAAGSTEDGGGHPMFQEGMTKRNEMIDNLVLSELGTDPPSDELRLCHAEKAILMATGEMKPEPGYTQIIPMSLTRIGQLVLVAVPSEFTTMAGRRLRDTVQSVLGSKNYYVIAGYTNDYAGYVTTREEYETQQYEGGHTLYGPWTLSAFQQEFARLSSAMKSGAPLARGPSPNDLRARVTPQETRDWPGLGEATLLVRQTNRSYRAGKQVSVTFLSGSPSFNFRADTAYLQLQLKVGERFSTVETCDAWSTKCRWFHPTEDPGTWHMTATWDIPKGTAPGVYRFRHAGNYTHKGVAAEFEGFSNEFKVKKAR